MPPRRADRRALGQYYTPPRLVETLLERTFAPKSLPTVCDPACGDGAFLMPAAARLAKEHARRRGAGIANDDDWNAIAELLSGRDVDPSAVATFRSHWATATAAPPPGNVRVGDARELLDQPRVELVVGNPPFANAIEGRFPADEKAAWAGWFPELRGTADRSYYFVALADRLAKPDGAVGLVLPRSFLAAPAARALRLRLERERPPAFLAAPDDAFLFPGANVFVALVVLRTGGAGVAGGGNWWPAARPKPAPHPYPPPEAGGGNRTTLGEVFEIFQSMTTAMAYALRDHVHEAGALPDEAPRLVTTGLLDPDVCRWGERRCRYLGADYQRPALDRSALPPVVAARVAKVRRPKLLVAGLSDRLEAWLDEAGQHVGAVATITILHPTDDLAALRHAAAALHHPDTTARLHAELGALALGGRRVTIPKAFVQRLPWPGSATSS